MSAQPKILVTGFEPFGTWSVNPSQMIVENLAANTDNPFGSQLITQVLPTEYDVAAEQLRETIKSIHPALVLCLGLTSVRDRICLERFALNIDDVPSRDNANNVREGSEIEPDGPPAVRTSVDLRPVLTELLNNGLPTEISNHAGTYVCNHVYYQMLRALERTDKNAIGVFVHVPMIEQGLKPGSDSAHLWQISELQLAVRIILTHLSALVLH